MTDNGLTDGAPLSLDGRSAEETAVYDFLLANNIPFKTLGHDAAFTMEECADVEARLGAPIPKNLFLCNRQKTAFFLLTMPGDKPFHTKDLTAQLGCSRLSFASADDMWRLLRTQPGAVSPMGLIFDAAGAVTFVMDEELRAWPQLGFHPCVNTATLRFAAPDFLRLFPSAARHTATFVTLPRDGEAE